MCLVSDDVGSTKELTTKGTVMQDRVQEVSLFPPPPHYYVTSRTFPQDIALSHTMQPL